MDDHKLRVFCTVAETKSFSKASEIIHLTQPAVSLQIQALEEIYETKLFDRSNNKVSLTRAGELLYDHAKEILNLYAIAEKNIGDITGLVKGSLSIGASSTIANYLLPAVVVAFRKRYPKIRVNMQVGNTKRILELLQAGNVDLGLVEGDVSRQKVKSEHLLSDELVLVTPPDHPWAKRRSIPITKLAEEPFIFREDGSGTRQVIERYLGNEGLTTQTMRISLILGSTEAIKAAVEEGMGVSILSQWAIRREKQYGTLKAVPIKGIKLARSFSVVFPKHTHRIHAFEEFLDFLKRFQYDELLSEQTVCTPCKA